MIYGIGTTYGATDEKFPEFVAAGTICIGWEEAEAPAIHQLFAHIAVGDIVFAKSFPPRQGLFIKGVGIVTSPELYRFPNIEGVGRAVRWVWTALEGRQMESMGRLNDHYDYFRGGTLFQEFGPRVQEKVINILLNPDGFG